MGKRFALRTKIAANGTSRGRDCHVCALGSWGGLIPDSLPGLCSYGAQVPLLPEVHWLHSCRIPRCCYADLRTLPTPWDWQHGALRG